MSGTSTDAIDAALLEIDEHGVTLLGAVSHPLRQAERDQIQALMLPGENEIDRAGAIDRQLGERYAAAVLDLIEQQGLTPASIRAIGSHGQTVRHRPPQAQATAFTLQIGDPNTIAERTGIVTVADFRRRDIAAGGEGAPLVPAFHAAAFGVAGRRRAIVNIGGIANVTLLQSRTVVAGFDTGPGNTLLDGWHERHRGGAFDASGAWSAEGTVDELLLKRLLAEPFLQRRGPRSTGRELFNLSWLDQHLIHHPASSAIDVQATLAELTAISIARAIQAAFSDCNEVIVCGGGAYNMDLLRRLQRQLRDARLLSTEQLGIAPEWVEAAAFAWLAAQTLANLPGNVPQVTGASGYRVLGGIYPGKNPAGDA